MITFMKFQKMNLGRVSAINFAAGVTMQIPFIQKGREDQHGDQHEYKGAGKGKHPRGDAVGQCRKRSADFALRALPLTSRNSPYLWQWPHR